jgi:hypothetical protein
MHTSKNSPVRVLLVFATFLLIAVGGLWLAGGRPTELYVEVHSPLSSAELLRRFERKLARLPELSAADTSDAASRTVPIHGALVAPISTIGLPGQVTIPVFLPLADVIFSSEPSGQSIIDPAIVFTDTKFFTSDAMELEWYGRDDNFFYLRELDSQDHIRLVKLDPDRVEFSAAPTDGPAGCVVRYNVTLQHSGWQRFYGKLYSRTCEESARVRLSWICHQLESNE